MKQETAALKMPVLPVPGLVVFPQTHIHFEVTREYSFRALEEAMKQDGRILLTLQVNPSLYSPEAKDLPPIGTICRIRQLLRSSEHSAKVMVEGENRGQILEVESLSSCLVAQVLPIKHYGSNRSIQSEAMIRSTVSLFKECMDISNQPNAELILHMLDSDNPGDVADFIVQNIPARAEDKQEILECFLPMVRIKKVNLLLRRELEILRVEAQIEHQTRARVAEVNREAVLREQMKAIQEELGEDFHPAEVDEETLDYAKKVEKLPVPKEVREKLKRELSRLERQPFGSPEGAVLRNYFDVVTHLPWGVRTEDKIDIQAVRKYLDRNHFGMDKVKERMVEFLAVRQLAPQLRGQILCLVGPPGVGKTSVALSVARAIGRKSARVSLGGVHDEAEIRGHRKTYIGSMPGRIITAIEQAGSVNPLLVLDEIDKLGTDYRGDPASALLEVLDPEQNTSFRDHFLEIPFDLSEVIFITTANRMETIPEPLLDRMELIELPSYTDEEKLQIAKKYLLPKQKKRHGIKSAQLKLSDPVLRAVITGYTKESGVRMLEQELAALCRKAAMRFVTEGVRSVTVTEDKLDTLLGPRKYRPERTDRADRIGVVNGLAWTKVGGELLQVEVNIVPGNGKLQLTGNLGEVMKESCKTALSYIRAHAEWWGIDPAFYSKKDVHVHFPAGAVSKDGPSAGIAITTALISALSGRKVRGDVAMTGEVTLQGRVLPIGGLREKTMGALREGITTVILPSDNVPDLEEIDQTVRAKLVFVPVKAMDAVLEMALAPLAETTAKQDKTTIRTSDTKGTICLPASGV